jgi:dolichol-phosphate mannosyltransferase
MGRRYLSTLLMMFFQRHLIADDLLADRLAGNMAYHFQLQDLEERINSLEQKLDNVCANGPPRS